MFTIEYPNNRDYDACGRNGFYRQVGMEVMRRTANYGEDEAEPGQPPPGNAPDVVILSGLHRRGLASGHLCIPVDQVPQLIEKLQELINR